MEIVVSSPKSTALVVKHNSLIEGRYDLTLQEKRLILWLVSEISPDDTGFKRYRVRIKELAEFVGCSNNHNIYREMVGITERIMERVLKVKSADGRKVELFHWMSYASYDVGTGYAEFSLSDELKPYLLDLKKNFTKLQLRYAIGIKSAYGVRIYELLKQYETIGERTIGVTDLRELCGIAASQYDKFKDFRVRVVDIAVREINERTDIFISYDYISTGRKVTAIRFSITRNPNAETPDPIRDDPKLSRLLSRLVAHGVAQERARSLVLEWGTDDPGRIEYAASELERRLKSKTDCPDNPAGWLVEAISNDWRPQPSLFGREEQEQRERARKAEARKAEIEGILKPVQTAYADAKRARVSEGGAKIDGLPRPARIAMHDAFREHLANQPGGVIFAPRFVGGQSWTEAGTLPHAIAFLREHDPDFDLPVTEQEYAEAHGLPNYAELIDEKKRLEQ